MPEIKPMLIVILFLISSMYFFYNTNDSEIGSNSPEMHDLDCTEILQESSRLFGTRGSRGGSSLLENNAHGGSWLDSFKDDSGIDWSLSDNLNLSTEDAKILIDFQPFQVDGNTVALWHFNEGTGSTLNDEVTSINDGTIYGSPTWSPGKFGKSIDFDGLDDYVQVNSYEFDLTTHTTSFWIKPYGQQIRNRQMIIELANSTSTGPAVPSQYGRAFSFIETYSDPITGNNVGHLVRNASGSSSNKIYGWAKETNTRNDQWNLVVSVMGSSGNKLYINGIKQQLSYNVGTSSSTYSWASLHGDRGPDRLFFGTYYYDGTGHTDKYYHGLLDEVMISDIERTPGTIQAYLTSKQIDLPVNANWDTLMLNTTQPGTSSVLIRILNATTNQPIPGSATFTKSGEFDISTIDSSKYPSIKLNATLVGNDWGLTPTLHSWGVSWNKNNAWRDTFFDGLKTGTPINVTSGTGELWPTTDITQWVKYPNNPILSPGTGAAWEKTAAVGGDVLYNGSGYMMWYVGGSTSTDVSIGLATSTDGITWTKYSGNPVLTKGSSGWDNRYIRSANIILDNGIYKMWYLGQDNVGDRRIGYATSTDGKTWQKSTYNPVINKGSGVEWDDHYAQTPSVYFDGGSYHMWYVGLNGGVGKYQIGYAKSHDGVNWTKFTKNPVVPSPYGSASAYGGLGTMFIIPEKDQYFGWYSSRPGSNVQVNFAKSYDGIFWANYTGNPVLQVGPSGTWDDLHVNPSDIFFKEKQYWMYYNGNDGSNGRMGIAKSKCNTGIITSKVITLPSSCYYDKLIVNKTEPTWTKVNVTILDGSTQLAIPNFKNLRGNHIDISTISPINHPSIILKATFDTTGYNTPILQDWSINWTENTQSRVVDVSSPLIVNRTFSIPISVNLMDSEETEHDLTLQIEYLEPGSSDWTTEYLGPITYETDHWECNFAPPVDAELGEYEFRFICSDLFQVPDTYPEPYYIQVRNNDPIIWNISLNPPNYITNRTHLREIKINASDVEQSTQDLIINIRYKSPLDVTWQEIEYKRFSDDLWSTDFLPGKTAALGEYIFNITCNDTVTEVYQLLNLQIVNNLPLPPEATLYPIGPKTLDDLQVEVTHGEDIETHRSKLKYWYRWYKDDIYIPEFDNFTIISHSETQKGQHWRCVVYVDDGDELGTAAAVAETTILNSPPELMERFDNYEVLEDSIGVLEEKLTYIFKDDDLDILKFSAIGNENITVEITQGNGTIVFIPVVNWFGTEAITFYANDSSPVQAEETVFVTVKPVNDLPRITHVGAQSTTPAYSELDFMVNQDEWLNLSVQVEDIDGDVARGLIAFIQNITESDNFYFEEGENRIIFHPFNEDVGWHYVNITITDNNETPLEYISQHIRIRVVNINDPPTVKIITPVTRFEFLDSELITFEAVGEDIDLTVWNSNEKLSYRWSSNVSEFSALGEGERLENIKLPPGDYNITVEVIDNGNVKAYDYVHITVKAPEEDKPTELHTNYLWLLLLIVIIIIIAIICVLLFVARQKKKRAMEAQAEPGGQVLQPDAAYLPTTGAAGQLDIVKSPQISQPQVIRGEPLAAAPTQELLGAEAATTAPGAIAAQTTAQLPPVVPGPPTLEPRISTQEKLSLLEERLLRGEIDQDVYLELKTKYELEAQPYQPPPQLPPAVTQPTTPSIETPSPITTTPIATITQPLPQAQPTPTPTPAPAPTAGAPVEAEAPPETIVPSAEVPTPVEAPPDLTAPEPIPPDLPSDAYQIPPQPPQAPQAQPAQPAPPAPTPAPQTTTTTIPQAQTQPQPLPQPEQQIPPQQPPAPPTRQQPTQPLPPQAPGQQQQAPTGTQPETTSEQQQMAQKKQNENNGT
ncbi:LamG-like jellyroll fold domain-containing protein [[Eubacterium] cellulosolvens]